MKFITAIIIALGFMLSSVHISSAEAMDPQVRCDWMLARQRIELSARGYRLDCTPPDTWVCNSTAIGCTDFGARVVYIRVNEGVTNFYLMFIGWHELGHAINNGWSEDQVNAWSWCFYPIGHEYIAYPSHPGLRECQTILASAPTLALPNVRK